MTESTMMKVLFINDRDGRKFWHRGGRAFKNRDGSINIYLDSLPINGATIQVRELDERDLEMRARRNGNGNAGADGDAATDDSALPF